MILKGSQRGSARQLAAHLLNDRDNDHVTLLQLRGFVAGDLRGALDEAHAIAKGTRCTQFLFSLSLNPPKDGQAGEKDFLAAVEAAEAKLGLTGQPRAIILHEKEGRRHAHAVWSRIDPARMRAINLPHFKRKLTDLSRELYLEHGWSLPQGLRRFGGKSPLNFTLAEWQQAKRQGMDPREIKDALRTAWTGSTTRAGLSTALAERGYVLARGDRRGFVVLDTEGEVYALARWAGVKTKDIAARLGDPEGLPSVEDARRTLRRQTNTQMQGFIREVKAHHAAALDSLHDERKALVSEQRKARRALLRAQARRAEYEAKARAERFRKGLSGLLDRITGRARTIRIDNEADLARAMARDRAERDAMAAEQMTDRQPLQDRLEGLRSDHRRERRLLARQIAAHRRGFSKDQADTTRSQGRKPPGPSRPQARGRDAPGLDR